MLGGIVIGDDAENRHGNDGEAERKETDETKLLWPGKIRGENERDGKTHDYSCKG